MKKPKITENLAYKYVEEGTSAFYDRKLNKAALSIQTALNLFKEAGDTEQYVKNLNLLGVIYGSIGNETLAVDFYLEGLECSIANQYYHMAILFYINIGSRYMDLGEYEKAIGYFLKAEHELQREEVKEAGKDRYNCWCMVSAINLLQSYTMLGEYEKAQDYMHRAEALLIYEENKEYRFTFMIMKYRLFWLLGRKEEVYAKLDEIVEGALHDENASDYESDTKEVCKLLADMNEFQRWKRIIDAFEEYSREQGTVYFQLTLTEMWMEYYRKIGNMNKYIHLCVDHAELYQQQKVITDKERAAAIDIKIELQEKEAARKRAEEKSNTDSLTDLGNRYMLENDTCRMQQECIDEKVTMAVGILDIDCFKEHNDTYGHLQGDDSLRKIAEVLRTSLGENGKAYRFGGDEFIVIIKDVTAEQVEEIAERIKKRIYKLHIKNKNSKVLPEMTISQGYCIYLPSETCDLDTVLAKADAALYNTKEAGRNGYSIC